MRESSLSAEQCEALKPFVEGKVIHDLGCGPMLLTKELLALGTTHIVAIDKEPIWPGLAAPGITFEKKHFNVR
jgi:predicted RNA methylase